MKVTPFVLALAVLAGSGSAFAATHSDFTKRFPLQALKTFQFKEQGRISRDPLINASWSNNLQTAIRGDLSAHGRTEAVGGAPDFYVAYSVGLKHRWYEDWDSVSYGLPIFEPDIRNSWLDWRSGYDAWAVPYTESTVTIDIIDARTNQLVWRGDASETLNPRKPEKTLSSAVHHVLAKFYRDQSTQDHA
jgi:hypothetical protein